MRYITTVEGKQFLVEIIDEKHVSVDGKVYEIDFESVSGQPVCTPKTWTTAEDHQDRGQQGKLPACVQACTMEALYIEAMDELLASPKAT